MHIHTLRVRNFRRLKNTLVDFAPDISILVGANNSGKTSASQVLKLFTDAARDRFSLHDFNSDCWSEIDAFGAGTEGSFLPTISIDIWFHADPPDLHRVLDLLPSLAWTGTLVGVRIEFAATDENLLLAEFLEAHGKAVANARPADENGPGYHPFPRSLSEYLTERLKSAFSFHYYVLDRAQFDAAFEPNAGYKPLPLTSDKGKTGSQILNALLKVDVLHAQRHLSDAAAGSRAEDVSKCLSRFYTRYLEKRGDDYEAMQALAESESLLNSHLERVFQPTLDKLSDLGYPGLGNPRLVIRSALNPASIMSSQDGAKVHYSVGDPTEAGDMPTLPDRYNGLGFKNLIYMVVELLGLHAQWLDEEEERPPLHLVFIEEPEAHLHAQLQQVFIRRVIDLLAIKGDDRSLYKSQLVVTTHSPHILFERGFRPIRYFRRVASAQSQTSDVINLSAFYEATQNPTRDFLERYLKLTHCDLFFADAAILVEGNVERLLLPEMIAKTAARLKSTCLSILEIGGAFGHRFRTLIEYLGLPCLIITDIDSVVGPVEADVPDEARQAVGDAPPAAAQAAEPQQNDEPEEANADLEGENDERASRKACMVSVPGAVTSNQTLIQWLPLKRTIEELLATTPEEKLQLPTAASQAVVRVTYQTAREVEWRETRLSLAGRTLEEDFAFQNLAWTQHADQAELYLRIKKAERHSLAELSEAIHKRVKGSTFNKTDFALALLACDPAAWTVPAYISAGLKWLEGVVAPLPPEVPPAPAAPAAPPAPLPTHPAAVEA